jgi:hypothetical protein
MIDGKTRMTFARDPSLSAGDDAKQRPAARPPAFFAGYDVLVVALLLVGGLLVWGAARGRSPGPAGTFSLEIQVLGHPERTARLERLPAEGLEIIGLLGPARLESNADGLIRVAHAPCPGQTCRRLGWVAPPETLCCVPNGIIVEWRPLADRSPAAELDGVSR